MFRPKALLIWAVFAVLMIVPLVFAAFSPLLEWRDPVYIMAGFAGIIGLAIMLAQPLLVAGLLPGLPPSRGRMLHRWGGVLLVGAVILHVVGLWITSPPDVIDVLLMRSPTPFAVWGLLAMWAVFVAALWAAMRKRIPLRYWRFGHTVLVSLAIVGTVPHAVLIYGTMETVTKTLLCAAVIAATVKVIITRKAWRIRARQTSR
ncbi:ferric reductase-like transmembrane domain-containing protein [Yoonia sp. BS5-3]|uniref:Ferric reductase-like transmembrane domain-containing protein n=1 Tax=Yoonia phaeophyticola TaxID=3137369 RepID=A0ABZ2V8Q5_9RHOB